jgi:AcrR family transcriptional regulator
MKETAERILDAALRVFGRDGVSGATTREIARVAGVNEVTLFRYFKNKNELLRQMVLRNCQRYDYVFEEAKLDSPADFRRTVRRYAEAGAQKLQENEDLVRTFMGELKRHLKLSRSLFVEASKASREKFIAYLQAAQKARFVRREIDPATATDALQGMLMAGMLRRPLTESMYDWDTYLATCVDIFLKGIEK